MHCCCGDPAVKGTGAPGAPVLQSTTWPGRARAFFKWALPVATLALVPKCPGCVAAYVLLLTGMSLSLRDATYLRSGIIAASIASLSTVAVLWVIRQTRRRRRCPD